MSLRVLVTGATGCIGGALVPRLLADGHAVRCLVRDPTRLIAPWRDEVELVTGAVEDRDAVVRATTGRDSAYYLVHGLDGPLATLTTRERRAAATFREGASRGGLGRIVYLGGLVDDAALTTTSEHLYARHEVGVELRAGDVDVVELRAGIVLAPESASVALLAAAARLPLQIWGGWASARVQPIALHDLLEVLVAAGTGQAARREVLDIGGEAVLSYEALVGMVRDQLGLAASRDVHLPYLPVEAAAPMAARLARIDPSLALALLQSVGGDAVVRDPRGTDRYAGLLVTPLERAVAAALG